MPHPERVFRTAAMSWHPADWGEDSPWMKLFYNARAWMGEPVTSHGVTPPALPSFCLANFLKTAPNNVLSDRFRSRCLLHRHENSPSFFWQRPSCLNGSAGPGAGGEFVGLAKIRPGIKSNASAATTAPAEMPTTSACRGRRQAEHLDVKGAGIITHIWLTWRPERTR